MNNTTVQAIQFKSAFQNSLIRLGFCSIVWMISLTISLIGQPWSTRFEFYGYDEGLRNYPTCMMQDSQDFLWFGASGCVYRFDGIEFKCYELLINDSTVQEEMVATTLFENSGRHILIGTNSGILELNPFNKSLKKFHTVNKNLNQANVTCLLNDQDKNIWVGTLHNGLFKINSSGAVETWRQNHTNDSIISSNSIFCIMANQFGVQQEVWVGTANGLNIINRHTGKVERVAPDVLSPYSLPSKELRFLMRDADGHIWAGLNGGWFVKVKQRSISDIRFERFNLDIPGQITAIEEEGLSYLWIGTVHNGLYRFNKKTQDVEKFYSYFEKPGFLKDDDIYALLRGRDDVLWVLTRWGLNKHDCNDAVFKYYPIEAPDDLWILGITGFCEGTDGSLWIATWGRGVFKMNEINEKYTHYMPDSNSGSVCSRWITCLHSDRNGNVWIGSDRGLQRYDPLTKRFLNFGKGQGDRGPVNSYIFCLYSDRQGNMWIGTAGGLSRWDWQSERFSHFLNSSKDHLAQTGFFIGALLQDSHNRFWMGGRGLFRFDQKKDKLQPFQLGQTGDNPMVFDLKEDQNGGVWIATFEGLFYLTSEDSVKFFSEQDGLPDNNIYGILVDDAGGIWAMTYKGLAKFNAKAENFITYPLTGNFMKDEFGIYGYYKARNGNLFLGQAQRFTFFDPLSLTQNHSEYPLLITEVSLFDQPLKLNTSLSKLPDIELSYRQNMLTINYCALNYHRSGDTRYSYRLIGLEEEWVDAGANRQVTYTYLQPGDYTFEVRAVNFVGRLSEQTASLNIVILPPWWVTWWFRGIIVLILIVLFYAIYRMRLSKILQMERMRVQIASDLHDDIGASLTRIAVHSEIIQSTDNSNSIRRSSGRIGVMSREIITTLSDIVWSIDARNDTVGDLLDRMRDFLDTVFPPGSIKIDFQTQGLHLNQKIAQEMRQNVYLIFKEAVNNAARHSGGSEISIRLINGNGIFHMSIADNGSGFDLNKKTAGHHGLENMRMRAERIGGILRIESNHGTRIVLETKSI